MKEIKICLPTYKLFYSIAFVLILSLVRGISRVSEIGIAMEAPIAFLSIGFCADTYLLEVHEKRRDVFQMYRLKKRTTTMFRRLTIQMVYLIGISLVGYGAFYVQKPIMALDAASPVKLFGTFLIAIIGTTLFWGTFSMTISNLYRNLWAGIGSSLLIWIGCNSRVGDHLLGKWNVFSFALRDVDKINDWSWMCGKAVSFFVTVIMIAVIPMILKKRG